MDRIEVRCICGKSYYVPPDKAGRRLQCRRCGNVQRIPSPGQGRAPSPGEQPLRLLDEPADPSNRPLPEPQRPAHAGRRESRAALRRCPACGLQDEPGVVICVRCGYDWRTGKRLRDADEASEVPDDPAAEAAQSEADRLASLSWLALSPAGVVVGPYIAWRSQEVEARLRRLMRHEASAAVRQVRLTAISGAALWLVVLALLGVLLTSRSSRSAVEVSQACRQRLEQTGRALRAKVQEAGEFPPPGRDLPAALRDLVSRTGEGALVCPAQQGLHPYRVAAHESLTASAAPEALIVWDQEPHADALGRPSFRALRFDGTIEVFLSRAELAAASRRPVFPQLAGGNTTPGGEPRDPTIQPLEHEGPAVSEADAKRQLTRLLAYAYECDDEDPELTGKLKVTREAFVQRLGLSPEQLLPVALADPDPKVRLPATRLAARLDLPAGEVAELIEPLAEDPQVEVRLVVGLVRQSRNDPRWLPLLCEVAEAGDPTAREVALGRLGAAAKAPAETRRILDEAQRLRGRLGAIGDDAIFPLPPPALPNAVALLTDPKLSREARSVLYSAGAASLEPLRAAFQGASPKAEVEILRCLDLLRRAAVLSLDDFLADVGLARDPHAQAEGVGALLQSADDEPPASLQAWALKTLRDPEHARQLEGPLAKLLGRMPGPALVDALLEEGDHRVILVAIQQRSRAGEGSIDAHLAEVWGRLQDVETRTKLTDWLAQRWHAASVEALLAAIADTDEGVRRRAGVALRNTNALRPMRLRQRVAETLAERLDEEESVPVRDLLYGLARDPIYCSTEEDEHSCNKRLMRSLRNLARKGDIRAIRAMANHANSKVAGLLLRLLDGASDGRAQEELTSALRGVTGSADLVMNADHWKAQLSSQRDAFEAHQLKAWQSAWGHFNRGQERAQRELQQLQGEGG